MFDIGNKFHDTVDGLALHKRQVIPHEFLDGLRAAKDASMAPLKGELHRVASVPVLLVEKWLKEGFNVYQAPAREILKRLRTEHLDAFITTNRAI